ncbi:DUF2180 family protein [Streptomyces tuirus]|uniref:DUF2180 family protein n=1 Tax=Streptomyces tuirus TaxID=68278 RepID=A0A941FF38_9ACTN|nr:DUF2180 family protein [Streptomyces tuirus]
MHCYDCLAADRTTVAAAVCGSCGAALCAEHVHEERKQVRQVVGMGKATHDPPARRLLCAVCSYATHKVSTEDEP